MKTALIELHTDLSGQHKSHLLAAIEAMGSKRDAVVREAIRQAKQAERELIVLPGWTLFGRALPDWLLTLSEGCTIVCELVAPGAHKTKEAKGAWRQTHVLRDRADAIRPVDQLIITASQIQDAAAASLLSKALLDPKKRRWRQDHREALLLVCGEVNVVGGGGSTKADVRASQALQGLTEDDLRGGKLVINPAHTPMRPQAVRDKRAWLSGRRGVLLTTANLYSNTSSRSAWSAAAAWKDSQRLAPTRVVGDARAQGFRMHLLTV